MGILKTLKNIFFKDKKIKHPRDFTEIFKSDSKEDAENIKLKLEKYKIPVYVVSKMKSLNDKSIVYMLRIPKSFEQQAKSILEKNE